ncbi:TrfB-related DNA-binding protein (plasmid) [Ralstonia pseudosolanacearum]
MKLKRLTPEDFDRIAEHTRMGDRARSMARAVLVDGRAQADVATEFGMTKQRVNAAVGAIERAFVQTAAPGTGLVSVSLELPESLALELANLVDAFAACVDGETRSKALAQVLRAVRSAKNSVA